MRAIVALLVLAVVLLGCSGSPEPSNGDDIARLVERWWKQTEHLAADDEFSADERACIAAHSEEVDRDVLTAAAGDDFTSWTEAYLAPYADDCISDAHLQEYFRVDMILVGLPPDEAQCQSPGIVEIVRDHGFDAFYADESDQIEQQVERVNDGCSEGPSSNGLAAVAIVESQWRANGQLRPGDTFSARERECIARNGSEVDLETLEMTSFDEATEEAREFMIHNADECFTDAHLQQFFVADMRIQGFTPGHAECMAPGVLDLVRDRGFADVFADRTVDVAGKLTELRRKCGVD